MDFETFWDGFNEVSCSCNQTSLGKQLSYLLSTEYDLKLESQPDAILHRFERTVHNYDDALLVAVVFKYIFGDIIICREDSYCSRRLMTIVQSIERMRSYNEYFNNDYLYEAFVATFGNYTDVSHSTLLNLYHLDDVYADDIL